MEHENNYKGASKGVANTALGLGIGAVAAELLGGNIGGILGGRCNEDHCVNRYEAAMQDENARLRTEIALRDANLYNDQKTLELYHYIDGKVACIEKQLCEQNVINAQITANLTCQQNAISALQALTKLVVPIDSICPTPAVATTA